VGGPTGQWSAPNARFGVVRPMTPNQDFLEQDRTVPRSPYPTDLTDEEWTVLEPLAAVGAPRQAANVAGAPRLGRGFLRAKVRLRLTAAPPRLPFARQTVFYHFRTSHRHPPPSHDGVRRV
jgi:hypothetical protein